MKNSPAPAVLAQLADRSHNMAIEKGWWGDNTDVQSARNDGPALIAKRNFQELMSLAISELMEAFEVARMPDFDAKKIWLADKKPEGFPIELADGVIRLFDDIASARVDCLAAFEYADHAFRAKVIHGRLMHDNGQFSDQAQRWTASSVGDQVMQVIKAIAKLAEEPKTYPVALPEIVWQIFDLADFHGIDLISAINMKIEYNSTRPFRHGNKKA